MLLDMDKPPRVTHLAPPRNPDPLQMLPAPPAPCARCQANFCRCAAPSRVVRMDAAAERERELNPDTPPEDL